jgi:predicted phosphodiesterase
LTAEANDIALAIVRLRDEEGRSWSAIGDTVGKSRDAVRRLYSRTANKGLPETSSLLEEYLRPISKPAPKKLPVSYSPASIDIIASDFHWPKSNKAAEAILLEAIKRLRPENVYLNGDLWDMFAQSKFDKEYRARFHWTPQDEADAGANFLYKLEEIVQEFDGKVIGLYGNHDNRWWAYLNRTAPALIGMKDAEKLLAFDKWWIPEWSRLKMTENDVTIMPDSLDPLLLTHGEIVRANGGASANATGRKYFSSVAHGHTHRIGVSVIRVPERGERPESVIRSFELGCIADLEPPYARRPDWSNGFGILVRDSVQKNWTIEPVTINGDRATIAALGGTISA